jgi:heme/copper-type cytochrome/quinol oxidase subunit 3
VPPLRRSDLHLHAVPRSRLGRPAPVSHLRHPVHVGERNDDSKTNLWLIVTALLGATFIGGQVYEFTAFYREGLGFTTSLFGSSFYTLTGFHGVHVSVGVILLLSTMGIIKKNRITGNKAEVVEMVGLYWHFVDIVWIVIFTLVYLIPA